jgi:C1A family cysteine protease
MLMDQINVDAGPSTAPIVPKRTGDPVAPVVGGRRVVGLGWIPDHPDMRDLTLDDSTLIKQLRDNKSLMAKGNKAKLPARVDNRAYCSNIEDQGNLGSCTANAVVGLMEYMMRRANNEYVDGSRLFIYKVTRKLLGWTGDTGAYLRSTIKSVAAFGMPPEQYFPYDVTRFEDEPDAFQYAFAVNYKAIKYARLDPSGKDANNTLENVKSALAAGYGVVFGFSVYSSISNAPDIPYPQRGDKQDGGHAVMIVGYDDAHKVGGKTVPSLIIRNSWGLNWGDKGYGYLPYDYVLNGLAEDFWTVFKTEWLSLKQFG